MTTQRLFPTRVRRQKWAAPRAAALNRALLREAYLFRELDEAGKRWSRKNYLAGYTSYSSITDLAYRSSNFARLKRWLDSQVAAFARELELDLGAGKLELTSFWINIMGRGCHHSFHLHPLSAVSGTYYLQVPKGSGELKLEDPRLARFMASPPRKASARTENQPFVRFVPKVGEVILFESWLKHEVTLNGASAKGAKGERVSVSFNYDWVRAGPERNSY